MSGPVTMYTIKPLMTVDSLPIQKNVMYEMKNIHEIQHKIVDHSSIEDTIATQINDQVTKLFKKNCSELKILEARQEKILSQLADIKKQVAIFRDVLQQSNSITKSSSVSVNHNPVTIDIILSANPKKPPFSILALAKIWTDSVFRIQSHVHSSIIGSVHEFSLANDKENTRKNAINLRLIWTDVPEVRLNCGLTKCPIEGEANFLRYLCRIVKSHSYEGSDPNETNLIDSILDFCHVSSYQPTKTVATTILPLNNHLTKDSWLFGKKEPSIADVALWSLIKRLNIKLTLYNLQYWFEECEEMFV